jgi:hypothetical protein
MNAAGDRQLNSAGCRRNIRPLMDFGIYPGVQEVSEMILYQVAFKIWRG